jgi:hypothetical protein
LPRRVSGARHHGPSGNLTAARAPEGMPLHYARHRPEQTTLYRLVQRHPGQRLPAPALRRVRPRQAAGVQLAKRRGFCPSCRSRRMSQAAANLMDHVIPQVPVRQWVLSLPIPLRLVKLLTRRGVLLEDDGQSTPAEPDTEDEEAHTLRPLQAGAVTYRIAFGPRAGRKVLTLRGAMPREAAARQRLCADIDGFSLHAAVRVEAHDRKRLERLCRYITRPALSEERIQARIATRRRSQPGCCVHTRARPNGRLRVVQSPAHGAC